MPSDARDPKLAAVYLDTSTLSYAVNHAKFGANNSRDLRALIERMAREGNLCLTHTHLFELSSLPDEGQCLSIVQWLDSLRTVWMREFHELLDLEFEALASSLMRDDASPMTTADAFCASYLTSWVIKVESTPLFLEDASATSCVRFLRTVQGRTYVEEIRQRSLQHAWAVRLDQINASSVGAGEQEIKSRLNSKMMEVLSDLAREAHERLIARRDEAYLKVLALHNGLAIPSLDLKWGDAPDNYAGCLRYFTLRVRASHAGRWRKSRMKANSKNFSKVHKSEADDFAHLTGAAYCDLFTCDTRIKDDLGRYRRLLGFRDAISFGNGVTEEQFITTIARDFDVISDFRGARAD